jgi:hypothetical protein
VSRPSQRSHGAVAGVIEPPPDRTRPTPEVSMARTSSPRWRRVGTLLGASALTASVLLGGATFGAATAVANAPVAGQSTCSLGPKGAVKHVIYIQFDNTHLRQDTPNVPSDLEQMPNLLNFMKDNGTLLSNDHTILISHTAGGILSSLTGVYPDRHGQTVSNSYVRTSSAGAFSFPSSFGYWTDPVSAADTPTVPNMITATGVNAPAPWVPYTRAGCDWGGIATANTVLENNGAVFVSGGPTPLRLDASAGDTTLFVGSVNGFRVGQTITIDNHPGTSETKVIQSIPAPTTPPNPSLVLTTGLTLGHLANTTVFGPTSTNPNGDLTTIYGANSPEWNEGRFSQTSVGGTADRALAQTDFVGFSIHCAQGSATCANGKDDQLPAEPGGYTGFKALHGAKNIDPLLTGQPASVAVTGLDGKPAVDPFGQPGFPGFDGMSASVSLAYAAEMQEAGVPITYAYISDAHDFHGNAGDQHVAFGPGSDGYVKQLKAYDDAFGAFFSRLAADGIDKSNTLFVFTVDEGDHFVGSQPANPSCDGVTVACDWTTLQDGHSRVGELNGNIDILVQTQFPSLGNQFLGNSAPNAFTVHGDDAPTFYLARKTAPGTGQLGQNDPLNREFERSVAQLTATNLYTNATDKLMVAMADQAEMKLLHMYAAFDPNRNANFAFFGDPNYFLTDFGLPAGCGQLCINPLFAWNHGDIQPEIANTWLGFVGPGIRTLGETGDVWTDHTDVRATMLTELGLVDSYQLDGRAILEILNGNAVPSGDNVHRGQLQTLGAAYKQLTAPFGSIGMDSLKFATAAIQTGSSSDDSAYVAADAKLADWLARRDTIAGDIRDLLSGLAAGGPSPSSAAISALTQQANDLIAEVHAAAP